MRGDAIFDEPTKWRIQVNEVIFLANECLDAIDENKYDIPDDLPSAIEMKKLVSESTLMTFNNIIEYICKTLNMTIPTINSYDALIGYVAALYELISLLETNDIDTIMKNDLYNKHEKAYDNSFAEILSVESSDLQNMAYIINSILLTSDEDED